MSALPEEVNRTLLQIVQAFASPDNQIRSVAEKALSEEWITENNIEYLLTFWLNKPLSPKIQQLQHYLLFCLEN